MNCKQAKIEYSKLKSIKSGLSNKLTVLTNIINKGDNNIENIIYQKKVAIDKLTEIDKNIKHIEYNFRFLKQGRANE